ncbi:hypothetical protein MKK63_29280 [Methylobacterium sp. J-088]|uniref:hypothetical protein n=1 Tax=unclassified Methylobacterium TaxID=2615210 RepID=UPI001FBAE0FE|nr:MULTISPECIES: hypothetical protein [unclassified Methylobacterium]MCJ2066755.1 hypothetical protein [Methylobacterium sp. J-088]
MTGAKTDFLCSEGVQELLKLTNRQFVGWDAALRSESGQTTDAGDAMDLWHILSYLALQPGLRVEKKLAFGSIKIASLRPETIRKYVAKAQRLGFIATIDSMGSRHIQLTPAGVAVVADTMDQWIVDFGEIQRRYFTAEPAIRSDRMVAEAGVF